MLSGLKSCDLEVKDRPVKGLGEPWSSSKLVLDLLVVADHAVDHVPTAAVSVVKAMAAHPVEVF